MVATIAIIEVERIVFGSRDYRSDTLIGRGLDLVRVGSWPLALVFLVIACVGMKHLDKLATDGECGLGTLTESSRSEMDTPILATYPASDNKFGADRHKPSVGVIVGRAGLATPIRIAVRLDVVVEAHTRATRLHASAFEQLLHEES